MSVDIEPFELSFKRPFTTEVARILTIKNTNSLPVAFKVKTTAPKQYCVRPNAGRIEPGQDFDVTVLLQAMKQEPPLDAKCRDKFLVQSAPITPDKEFASIASVLDSTVKGNLLERKIRVNWLASTAELDDSVNPAVAVTPSKPILSNGASDTPDAGRTFSSPRTTDDSNPSPPPYATDADGADDTNVNEKDEPQGVIAQAASVAATTAQMTYEELKAKLTQAEAQIASLKDNGLRQRNVKGSSEDDKKSTSSTPSAQAVRQTVEGVPVQMAAILCLLSFLLAYFFF